MAGSYNHIVQNNGRLIKNEPPRGAPFSDMIENLGDAYEAIEQMYGMIWWLATAVPDLSIVVPAALVDQARTNYKIGLTMSEQYAERKLSGSSEE